MPERDSAGGHGSPAIAPDSRRCPEEVDVSLRDVTGWAHRGGLHAELRCGGKCDPADLQISRILAPQLASQGFVELVAFDHVACGGRSQP